MAAAQARTVATLHLFGLEAMGNLLRAFGARAIPLTDAFREVLPILSFSFSHTLLSLYPSHILCLALAEDTQTIPYPQNPIRRLTRTGYEMQPLQPCVFGIRLESYLDED